MKHAKDSLNLDACITTVDTDIAIYALYFSCILTSDIYIKIGAADRKRILDVTRIAAVLGRKVCQSLPALHAFTGNDYTSAFFGIGKGKAFKILLDSEEFQLAFGKMGNSYYFDSPLFNDLNLFVSKLYGISGCENTDEARYKKFVSGKKTPDPQYLPPTRDALLCHCKRVTYVTAVVKNSLNASHKSPSPDKKGWIKDGETLSIQWMLRDPAPAEVLQLLSCNCKKNKCIDGTCLCYSHGLKCSDLCNCTGCSNTNNEDSTDSDDESVFDSDDDLEDEIEVDFDDDEESELSF